MAVVLTPVQTKQIRINIHQRNNTKNTVQTIHNTIHTIQNTIHTSTHITKTLTQLSKHPHIQHTHTHTQITKQVKTATLQDTHQMK